MPDCGFVGISMIFMPSDAALSRMPKYVGLSIAITSPGFATARGLRLRASEGAAGHGYIAWREVAAHIRRAAGNLTPQHLYPGRKIVARAVLRLAAQDAAQDQI